MPRLAVVAAAAIVACPAYAADKVDFARDVLPILSDNCFHCHGPDEKARKGDLRLDTRDGAMAAITPGKSGDSEAFRRLVTADASERMPPRKSNKTLTPAQVDTLKRWIDRGAAWGQHWAFVPPVHPPVPTLRTPRPAPRTPIDAFVFARLEREGLTPAPEADRERLIRRVTLDLTGLPPTPAEVDAFLADKSPDAYERVVDRLLASPRYGERMVWEWLDAARYADSNGYQGDGERTMWPWRDWAVKALNDDVPFDRFTVWQLAGDLLPNATPEQKLATAFLRNHMINGEGGRIAEENRVDYVMDMAETVGTVWLGLTFNCCRCHDHKFDPLAQREYYSLFAFFNQTPVTGGGGDPQTKPVLDYATPDQLARVKKAVAAVVAAGDEIDALERFVFPRPDGKTAAASEKAKDLSPDLKKFLDRKAKDRGVPDLEKLAKHFQPTERTYAGQLTALAKLVAERTAANQAITRVMVMEDMPKGRDSFVYDKGLYSKPGEKVTPGVPASLPPLPKGAAANRLALAEWLVTPGHPLTARVMVNRLWQQFFGVGLVKTSEDFGVQGERPVNQELLDWLACEFVAPTGQGGASATGGAWSLKRLVRLIVTSHAYRQSSRMRIADCGLRIEDKPPAAAAGVAGALIGNPQSEFRNPQYIDPENRLLARGPRFRLPSWMIRDQALAASGLLAGAVGGPPVRPYQPPGIWEEATFGTKRYVQDHGDALYRRSVYTFWRRIVGPTMFFDASARQTCAVKPSRTNTPLHALSTLNDATYVEAARALAERVLTSPADSDAARVSSAFRLVLARKPTADEAAVLHAALKRLRGQFAADPAAAKKLLAVGESERNGAVDPVEHSAFASLCHLILNLDEALSKE